MATPQERFQASLNRATAGITYTPSQISGLTDVAKQRGITDAATLQVIADAPKRPVPKDEENRGTDPVRVYDTSDYSAVAPALSSAQLGAFGERRRIAQEEYEKTLAAVARNNAVYRSDAERQRENQEELATRYIADSTRELAGKGVARAPMFMGRMARAADQDLQMKWGEIDSELGIELSALKSLVDNARSKKETELARIDQDVASARSNLNAIFSAASMYGNV